MTMSPTCEIHCIRHPNTYTYTDTVERAYHMYRLNTHCADIATSKNTYTHPCSFIRFACLSAVQFLYHGTTAGTAAVVASLLICEQYQYQYMNISPHTEHSVSRYKLLTVLLPF